MLYYYSKTKLVCQEEKRFFQKTFLKRGNGKINGGGYRAYSSFFFIFLFTNRYICATIALYYVSKENTYGNQKKSSFPCRGGALAYRRNYELFFQHFSIFVEFPAGTRHILSRVISYHFHRSVVLRGDLYCARGDYAQAQKRYSASCCARNLCPRLSAESFEYISDIFLPSG